MFHKNIVRYHTSWIEKDNENENNNNNDNNYLKMNLYVQMELMNMNLKEYLSKYIISNENKNFLIDNILLGIQYLHNNDIIHCDLHPKNILLNIQNDKIRDIKIADFGLVIKKNTKDALKNSYGSPVYRPPDEESYTEQYDIYSLGVIFFEITHLFNTDMEKYIEIDKLKNNEYYDKFPLLSNMVSKNPNYRPDLITIKKQFNNIITLYNNNQKGEMTLEK